MTYLRASITMTTFIKFMPNKLDYSRLDMSKFYKLFSIGNYADKCTLNNTIYGTSKTVFEKLPRCVRYNISEKTFEQFKPAMIIFMNLTKMRI